MTFMATCIQIALLLVYAEEDYRYKDLLVVRPEAANLPVESAVDMPNREPWVPRWKIAC